MKARALIYAADGRFQPPWRILAFLLVTALFGLCMVTIMRPLIRPIDRFVGMEDAGETIAVTLAIILSNALFARRWERRSWSFIWLNREAARPRLWLFGFATGAVPIAATAVVLLGVGWLDITPSVPGSWIVAALKISLVLLPAALFEELFSRGYVFATLGEWLGWPVSVTLTSVVFGLLHLGNPNPQALPIITVIIAGIYLAAVILVTKSMYAAWMSHFAWNWVMAVPMHIAVSGVDVPRPDYQMVETGPDWITGGPWGPEGGAAAVVGMGSGLAYLYWRKKRTHEQLER